jgi:hypothetical protein
LHRVRLLLLRDQVSEQPAEQALCRQRPVRVESIPKSLAGDENTIAGRSAELIEFPVDDYDWLDEIWDPSKHG